MNRFPRPQANPQNDHFAPTYNPEWINHPNFYKNQNRGLNPPPDFQAPQALLEKKSDLKELIRSYITSNEHKLSKQEDENAQKWNKQELANQNMGASLKNLETQLG